MTKETTRYFRNATLIASIAFLFVVLKNAWICDDAYIIFRSIEQLFAGHGPIWNPHERVQAFTSPLWFWVLSVPRIFSHDVYLNAFLVSVLLAVPTLVLIRRTLQDDTKFVLAVLLLVCCNGFLDFTTSGLENPLAYLLIAFYLLHYIRLFEESDADPKRSLLLLSLAFGLLLVTRHDLLLLLFPSFVFAVATKRRSLGWRGWTAVVALAFGPLAAWSAFALIYYGLIIPNSALSKLNTGIPTGELIRQGSRYLIASLRYDTIAVIVMAAALMLHRRKTWAVALALGIIVNVVYIVYVGGDFMLGRFTSFAYLVSVISLLSCVTIRRTHAMTAAAMLVVYAVAYPHTPVKTGHKYVNRERYFGVSDERGNYFSATSIYRYLKYVNTRPDRRLPYFPRQDKSREGYFLAHGTKRLTDSLMIGFLGYWAGTKPMIVDGLGLADPLVARLPVLKGTRWRPGHYVRGAIPGYRQSLLTGNAELVDPQLNEYYKKLKIITQGPVFSRERLETIVAMNLGKYDKYLQARRLAAASGDVGND